LISKCLSLLNEKDANFLISYLDLVDSPLFSQNPIETERFNQITTELKESLDSLSIFGM
jgi:hypothetical protein